MIAANADTPPWPRAVLFDMDGVLLSSVDAWLAVTRDLVASFGGPPVDEARFYATFGQGVAADMAQFYPGRGRDEVEEGLRLRFRSHLDALRPMDGAAELLAALEARGIARAVVTNTPTAQAEEMLDRIGLLPAFAFVVGSGDAADKPAPDLILLALGRLGARPGEALFVGDSWADARACRAAGVAMLGLGTDQGDRRIAHLSEVLDSLSPPVGGA